MNPWINYHHLYYFKVIAEQGTVVKAAVKLRLGQPTLSAQLKLFEETLGVQLFERQHKRLILTEQGRVALEYAKSIFRLGSEMYEVLKDRLQPLRPTLHVGSLDSVPKQIVLMLTKHAYQISDCQITLSEGTLGYLLRELMTHRMDLLVTNHMPVGIDAKGLFPKLLTKKNVSFFAAPKYLKLVKGFPHSMSGQPMIFPTYDSKLRYDMDHWAKSNEIEMNIIAETQDISTKKLMAVAGMGIIPVAEHSVTSQLAAKQLIRIGTMTGIYEELYLISANRKITNPIAAKLTSVFSV